MTCGAPSNCVLCASPRTVVDPAGAWIDSHGRRVSYLAEQEPAYEGFGNLADEIRTGKGSHKPHIRLCTGCLKRVLGDSA